MTPSRRRRSASAAAVVGLLLCAQARAAVKNPDSFTYLTSGDPETLDPHWATDVASLLVIGNVYEGLLAYDADAPGHWAPRLASQVPSVANGLISADGLTYEFPIRAGVHFHDGSTLTPEDVRYSLMRFCLMDRDGGRSAQLLEALTGVPSSRGPDGNPRDAAFAQVIGALAVKDDRLIVRLKVPRPALLAILSGQIGIVSRKWTLGHGGWDGGEATWKAFNNPKDESASPLHTAEVGTGPFKVERWDKPAQELLLVRNADYWRAPARLEHVRLKIVPEFATRRLMLQAGDADSISAGWADYSKLKGMPDIRITENVPTAGMNPVLFFNFEIETAGNPDVGSGKLDGEGIPPDFFADKDVRLAVAYSVDYDALIKDVYRGHAQRATGCIPRTMPGHDPTPPDYVFDSAKAAEHFGKAFNGALWEKGFHFTLAYNSGNSARQVIGEMLKKNIEALNPKFRVDTRPILWSTYLSQIRDRKLPLIQLGLQADDPDPNFFAFNFLHSQGMFPKVQSWRDARADAWVDAAVAENDGAKLNADYAALQALERAELPHILLVEPQPFRVEREWVRGWKADPYFPDGPGGTSFYELYKE